MTSRPPRIVALVLVAASLLAAGTFMAHAQTAPTSTGVEITPATLQQDLPNRTVSSSVLVVNHEATPRKISLSVSGLGHDLDGTPEFLEPSPVAAALRLDATSFVLGAGERKQVAITGSIPSPGPGLYASVIAEFAPVADAQGGSIQTRTRVATLVLIRGPKPWKETVEVVDVGVTPGASGQPSQVYAAVRDTGDVHVKPSGTATIVKDGATIATVPLPGANILPGFARRLVGSWTPPAGLTGQVTIKVKLTAPDASGEGTATFDNSVVNQPAAKLTQLRAADHGGPLVTMTLTNTGTVALSPTVTVTATQQGIERARTVLPVKALAKGTSTDLEWKPDLDDGIYLIKAVAADGTKVLDEASTGLQTGRPGQTTSTHRAAGNGAVKVSAAILLFIILIATGLFFERRRRSTRPTP